MGIDFHDRKNRNSYTTRHADDAWIKTIDRLVPIERISLALDIGCGGGIYSQALANLDIKEVIGIDYSEAMLEGARENCREYSNLTFRKGDALNTRLKSKQCGFVLERALIHHITDLDACFQEAHRILEPNGYFIVQDRTPEDCFLPGSENHIRGYFFDLFPRLKEKERMRRHSSQKVTKSLKDAGFHSIEVLSFWETRSKYPAKEPLLEDIRKRTGRSILHELNDDELALLIKHIDHSLPSNSPITEKDRWTIWKAVK
ncbi:class I SAM-dependent methyltransferase [Virgibacillus senegalensis]|uniref:class I SAM-dependent methyltransferase n=1 Tax=Virgibacillus senegalensis TaxID=1499679 RepID=UPI00069FD981|nr:class I SAM-dependent methyltransferase [Virgibacillus senegalensis]